MENRRYYSARTGKDPGRLHVDLDTLRRLFYATYITFYNKDYFQQSMGYDCVDDGRVHGTMGPDLEVYSLLHLRKSGLFPLESDKLYSEEDVFDLIEFLFDHVSKPLAGTFHSWGNCGWHYTTFEKPAGQEEFRTAVNRFLVDYQGGWELSASGEILSKADPGMENLFSVTLPDVDKTHVNGRVEEAIKKFRRHKSSISERKDAVRDLADVLEYLRPLLKTVLAKQDEADLFNIANNFSVRHHNQLQKTEYDQPIWLSWMFYFYLSTIHAAVRLIQKQEGHHQI